jgi:hypothetical protein
LPHQSLYKLRNTPSIRFSIEAETVHFGEDGAVVHARIRRNDGVRFGYEVCFSREYCHTKPRFDGESYLHTALSVVHSQLESHIHRDTRITLQVNSGMPRTELDCPLQWDPRTEA